MEIKQLKFKPYYHDLKLNIHPKKTNNSLNLFSTNIQLSSSSKFKTSFKSENDFDF